METVEKLRRDLADRKGALQDLRTEMLVLNGSAEVWGDWSKREKRLEREIAELTAKLARVD